MRRKLALVLLLALVYLVAFYVGTAAHCLLVDRGWIIMQTEID